MRSKAPLALMEQMVMLLVFALAAALCLQAFVKSEGISAGAEARDRAVTAAQNAAETVKGCKGDLAAAARLLGGRTSGDDGSFLVDYTADWQTVPEGGSARYLLGVALRESPVPGMGAAVVWVQDLTEDGANDMELFRMEFAWQEVSDLGC